MKLYVILTALILSTTAAGYSEKEEDRKDSKVSDMKLEDCKPIVMNFVKEQEDGTSISGSTVITCNGSYYSLQDTSTIHMMTEREDQICYADYSCGNLEAWEGYFSIAGESYYGTLGAFLSSGVKTIIRRGGYWGRTTGHIPSLKVGATLSFGRGELDRSCTEISDKVCFSK